MTDLLVSVRGSRIVLRSRSLDKEIVPRLTTAHNFSGTGGLGLYRFLCTLQAQVGASGLDFGPFDLLPFRPRVRTGRFVLATRRWRLDNKELEKLGAKTRVARFAAAQALWAERTGDAAAREQAFRAFNWATYMADARGVVRVGPREE